MVLGRNVSHLRLTESVSASLGRDLFQPMQVKFTV